MLKVNELKSLRTSSQLNTEENEEDQNKTNMNKTNMSNNSKDNSLSNIVNKNKTNPRIEIEAQTNEKKIFMTDYNLLNFDNKDLFSFHDMIIPGGKNAKLCMINDPFNKNLRATEIADHFKFYEPTPVINLIGANTKRKGKLFAGLTRAGMNTRAIIIDSGLHTGLEKFCIRKNLNLIGIAPENMIEFPIPNPTEFSNKMLTSGHTHFILLGGENKNKLNWGDEHKFKLAFAERLAHGRKGFPYKSKVVGVILGNIPNCEEEINYFIDKNWPLILIEDSEISQIIKTTRNGQRPDEYLNQENSQNEFKQNLITKISKYSKIIEIEDDSEILASAIHLSLTISF